MSTLEQFSQDIYALKQSISHESAKQKHQEDFRKLLKKAPSLLFCQPQDIELTYGVLTQTHLPKRLYKLFGHADKDQKVAVLKDLYTETREQMRIINGEKRVFNTRLSAHINIDSKSYPAAVSF